MCYEACVRKVGCWQWSAVFLALEAGHAGAHDLVHEEKVGGDDGARVDHLLLHPAHLRVMYIVQCTLYIDQKNYLRREANIDVRL